MADDLGSSLVRTDFGELSDAELVRATRQGSRRAYATLWKRHSVSALKYAKTLTASDADDVVSEAFLKVYAAIKAGRGPEEDFRYYIRSAVRNTYVSMVRATRSAPAGDAIEEVVGDRGAEIASVRSFDGSATVRAFLSLPRRWQEVLWYTEVEGLSRERTAAVLGMNANAVSALSFRAREALRTAWLQEHISTRSDLDRGCEAVTPLLGGYSRRALSRRDRLRVEHHVNGCTHCTSVVEELSVLLTPGRLALVLLPVALAGGGFAAFASKLGGGSAVLASASTIATPTATVVATVGGSAASGAAALTVVGKVAACALVATMIVPPTQMLIEAAHHSVGQTPSASTHAHVSPAPGAALHADIVIATAEGGDDRWVPVSGPGADASPDDVGAEGSSRGAQALQEPGALSSGVENANLGRSENPNAGGAGDGGRPSAAGKPEPDPVDRANPNAYPRTNEAGAPAPSGKRNPNPAAADATDGGRQAPEGVTPASANATGALHASTGGGTKPTGTRDAPALPNENANAGGSGAAAAAADPNAGGAASAADTAASNAGGRADPAGGAPEGGGAAPAAGAASPVESAHVGTAPDPSDSMPGAAQAPDPTPASAGPPVAAGASAGG